MTPGKPPPIVEGNQYAREYHDMLGRPLSVGDFFFHAAAHSSSVYVSVYQIVGFKDLDAPVRLGTVDDGYGGYREVKSWNRAYKIKAVSMDYSPVTQKVTLPKVWVKRPPPKYCEYIEELDITKHKASTISAVERIIRLDLDV